MRIAKHHRDIGVAEELAHRVEVDARLDQTTRKMMPLIPPAELETLFRQPDYSGNGRSGALFSGGSRERVRIGGGIITGY